MKLTNTSTSLVNTAGKRRGDVSITPMVLQAALDFMFIYLIFKEHKVVLQTVRCWAAVHPCKYIAEFSWKEKAAGITDHEG